MQIPRCRLVAALGLAVALPPRAFAAAEMGFLGRRGGKRRLAFLDIPSNFGETIAKVGAMGPGSAIKAVIGEKGPADIYRMARGTLLVPMSRDAKFAQVKQWVQQDPELWGTLNPDLQQTHRGYGCSMYNMPPKYWPDSAATEYFGDGRTSFGVLRDPYDRIVSLFRNGEKDKDIDRYRKTCDVNGGVKAMLKRYLAGNMTKDKCLYIPQSEFFEPPRGVAIPVDARRFPESANEVLEAHGYNNTHIDIDDVMVLHPGKCSDAWAGVLDEEAKSLVQQVYASDFKLICKHFGYCDQTENTCLKHIPQCCPEAVQYGNDAELVAAQAAVLFSNVQA